MFNVVPKTVQRGSHRASNRDSTRSPLAGNASNSLSQIPVGQPASSDVGNDDGPFHQCCSIAHSCTFQHRGVCVNNGTILDEEDNKNSLSLMESPSARAWRPLKPKAEPAQVMTASLKKMWAPAVSLLMGTLSQKMAVRNDLSIGQLLASASKRKWRSCEMAIRVCSIVSRSRKVTHLSSSVSKSIVTHHGVPTSSWRR